MMNANRPQISVLLTLLVVVVPVILLGVHSYYYLPFIADDALISLRYAQRFADGHGLNWNPGERVEGYSNLLWVVAAAAMKKIGFDLITAVRFLGGVCMVLVILALAYGHRPRRVREATGVAIALAFFSLAGPSGVWTIGGMEQPLLAALLAWAVVLSYSRIGKCEQPAKQMFLPGLLLALICLTRLDGAVFTAGAMLGVFLTERLTRRSIKRAMGLGLLPLLFVAGQSAFRLVYYREWIPNTALVKFTPSGIHTLGGLDYLAQGSIPLSPLIVLALASVILSFRQRFRRSNVILILSLLISWAGYIVIIGGDIFPGWRHFVPIIVLLTMLVMIGVEWICRFARRAIYITSLAAGLVLLVLFSFLQFRDSENLRAKSERWEWDGKVIGTLLKKAFGAQQPLLAVDPAGCLPYWSELPSLDMLGLNDHYLPRHPPQDLGQGAIGHELGDGKYVLDRRPDLVIFLLPTGNDRGYFRSGREMEQDERFHRDYTIVWFEGREPYTTRSRIWVRKESERIGIKRSPARIDVPGFLLNGNVRTITYLDQTGVLVVPASRNDPARVSLVDVPAGRWRFEIDANGGSRVEVQVDTQGGASSSGEVDLKSATSLRIDVFAVADEVIEVRRLSLVRVDGQN